jgi:hypothetical protein
MTSFEARFEADEHGDPTWTIIPLEDSRKEEVRELAAEGKSVRAIAKELGISKSAVGRILAGNPPSVPASHPPKRWDSGTLKRKSGTLRGTAVGQQRPNLYAVTKNGESTWDSERDSDET